VKKLWCFAAVLLLFALSAQGEVIKLRDGSELKGEIVSQTKTEVRLKLDDIEISIAGDEIVSIDGREYKTDINAMYQEQLDALAPTDADGHFRLAEWCGKKGLKDKREELIAKTLEIDPSHPGANKVVGNVFRDGRWQTPAQLRAQGLVFYRGRWMTKDEMNAAKGLVRHMGTWVTKQRQQQIIDRTFSRYVGMRTHKVCDLMRECMRIELFNRLKLTKEQMQELFPTFGEAENRRQEYLRRRNEINEYVEEKYLALKEAIMFGVIVSFDKPKEIRQAEGPAVDAEYKLIRQKKGYNEVLGNYMPQVFRVLTHKQKLTVYMKYCACCHQMNKCSECAQCHSGQGGMPAGVKANPAALQALTEARAMSTAEFIKKKEKLMKPFIRPVTDARSKAELREKEKAERESVCSVFEEARKISDTEFEKRKFLMSAQLGARGELERARIAVTNEMNLMKRMKASAKSKGMWVDCLFDGTFYNLLASRLGKRTVAKVMKAKLKEKEVPMGLVEVTHERSGRALLERICTQCHTLERIMKARKDPGCWAGTVKKMTSSLPEEDKKYKNQLVEYLVELELKKVR